MFEKKLKEVMKTGTPYIVKPYCEWSQKYILLNNFKSYLLLSNYLKSTFDKAQRGKKVAPRKPRNEHDRHQPNSK